VEEGGKGRGEEGGWRKGDGGREGEGGREGWMERDIGSASFGVILTVIRRHSGQRHSEPDPIGSE
jgi:hypothetical protein